MASQNMLRTCELKLKNRISLDDAVDLDKCHKQIKLPIVILTCASHFDLPSNLRIMMGAEPTHISLLHSQGKKNTFSN